MRFTRSCLSAAFAMLAMASVAQATPISFSDTFDPANQRFDNVPSVTANCTGTNGVVDTISGQVGGECEVLSYTHVLQPPYIPLTDTLASAVLSIYVYDDETGETAAEKLDYSLDAGSLTGFFPAVSLNGNDSPGNPFVFAISVLAQVAIDGTLTVQLDLKSGDLMFAKSELIARGERQDEIPEDPQLPEPATLALLGLAAAASLGRKRFA